MLSVVPPKKLTKARILITSDKLIQARMEKLWRENLHKKVKEKRADEELREYMNEWSYAKSHFQAESARKRESQYLANRFMKRGFSSNKVLLTLILDFELSTQEK
jgi:coenzyme F420-reducing hydrogenase alpha subunit